jgi:hypothetical protein
MFAYSYLDQLIKAKNEGKSKVVVKAIEGRFEDYCSRMNCGSHLQALLSSIDSSLMSVSDGDCDVLQMIYDQGLISKD